MPDVTLEFLGVQMQKMLDQQSVLRADVKQLRNRISRFESKVEARLNLISVEVNGLYQFNSDVQETLDKVHERLEKIENKQ